MPKFYTQEQIDQQGLEVGKRVKAIKTELTTLVNDSKLSPEERQKLASLESSKFLGVFTSSTNIPLVGAVAGNYADVDAGIGVDAERWIFDTTDQKFVKSNSPPIYETPASVKSKYESNPDTNAFTNSLKTKLENITEASDITSFTTALEGALV